MPTQREQGPSAQTLYFKDGKRYRIWGQQLPYPGDMIRVGEFLLTHCPAPGHTRYQFGVMPARASFLAAAEMSALAMEKAITNAAIAKPHPPISGYTDQQRAIIERFRYEMCAAGGLVPDWWSHISVREIVEAGIAAVSDRGPVQDDSPSASADWGMSD